MILQSETTVHADKNDEAVTEVLRVIDETLRNGKCSGNPVLPKSEKTRMRFLQILADIRACQQFTLAMAGGDLTRELPVQGYMAGSLKSLQSNLRHLTWQAEQIAGGDLRQRVRFMGEFSSSFNTMAERLARNETERIEREAALKEANAALTREIAEHRRVRMELELTNRKLNILSNITRHDIRNQLMALDTYISLSRDATGNPALLETYLQKKEKILSTIVNQINFTGEYENLGIKEPVWNSLQIIIAAAHADLPFKDVQLVTESIDTDIYADLLFSRVFYNLIDNALSYGGEKLSVVRITSHEEGEELIITVEDDGYGIAPKDKAKLFSWGFGKNTGLGLHLSREILSLTGISIIEDSEPGSGARFRIRVPRHAYRFRQ
jgi:signal transduction histidine kinase